MSILPGDAQDNHLLRAALDYARRGWRVMPLHSIADGKCSCGKDGCRSEAKHPRTRRGLKEASVDEGVIRAWWADWPTANVGIATGPESGFFMVGPDGRAGIEALAELEKQHGTLPTTPRLRSGGGGQHYYFRWPSEGGIKTGANYNGLPIDVRGTGGLVVAPPSLHKSAGVYAWEVPRMRRSWPRPRPGCSPGCEPARGRTGRRRPPRERSKRIHPPRPSLPPTAKCCSP